MEKPADTRVPIHDLIRRRWSPRAFDSRDVEPEKLATLFEAARWAPSSSNEQPWAFVVATRGDGALYEAMLSCLVDANRRWVQAAPVVMLSVAKKLFERSGKENRHYFHDTGLATANVLLQAVDLGLAAHPMAGFHIEKAREVMKIPETHEPVAMFAIGYPADPSVLPDDLRQRELAPRTRRDVYEFVFKGQWGNPRT